MIRRIDRPFDRTVPGNAGFYALLPLSIGLVIVAAASSVILLGCGSPSHAANNMNAAQVTQNGVYGWSFCPKWNAMVYSDGSDLIWKDLATAKRFNLTGVTKNHADALMKHKVKKLGHVRQLGSELFPDCSSDGTLIAFAAHRENDNEDTSDDKDSDIWAIKVDEALINDLKSGRNLQGKGPIPIYTGPIRFIQVTNYRNMQESMPKFGPNNQIYFIGPHKSLWHATVPAAR
ncbi:MAG: hypothetical protein J7M25_12205 [Deltaproteobacteria bacterium]|nr:hypothetical protein [Deltaproteobacteria bacterium]